MPELLQQTLPAIESTVPAEGTADAHATPKMTSRGPSKILTEYYAPVFLLLIACFLGLSFFVLRPRIQRVKELNAQTASVLRTIEAERAYLRSVDQSVAAAQVIAPTTLEAVNTALPAESNTPSLLQQFGAVAQQQAIQIDSINFTEQTQTKSKAADRDKPSRVIPVDVALSIRARSYLDVKRFLASLEESLRLMDVVGITASGRSDTEVGYQLQLRTYVLPPSLRPVQ